MAGAAAVWVAVWAVAAAAALGGARAWEEEGVGGPYYYGPDLDFNDSCNTGNCASGGIKSYFEIPLAKGEGGYKESKYEKGDFPSSVSKAYKVKSKRYSGVVGVEAQNATACCRLCKFYAKCSYYLFVRIACGCDAGLCFLYGVTKPKYVGPNGGFKPSTVGAKCQKPDCNNDPHLTGAHGTKYDFQGAPGRSFCLVTDRRLHVNMRMAGYVAGPAVRTWIRELGVVWRDAADVEHTLLLVARAGKETARGGGFLAAALIDGGAVPRLRAGEEAEGAGGLRLALRAYERAGPYDVDFYSVRIAGLLDMDVRLRVANPLLQTPEEAYAHISVAFNSVEHTEAIHGVLGQTYREGRDSRTERFSVLSAALLRPVEADGESGRGFLDGRPADYVLSAALATDCAFSAYGGRALPAAADADTPAMAAEGAAATATTAMAAEKDEEQEEPPREVGHQ